MKIFLQSRTIEFLTGKPAIPTEDCIVAEFESRKQLRQVWKKFESDKSRRMLYIWSANEDPVALKEFYSFFRIIDAGGGLVRNEKGEILFIFRYGKWDLPKGKLVRHHSPDVTFKELNGFKINENPVEAAVREVKEETGLKEVSVLKELSSTYHVFYKNKKRLLKRTYWFEMSANSNQSLEPQKKEGITLVEWKSENQIREIIKDTYPSLQDLILTVTRDA